jgi:FAD synthetase
MKSVMAFGSFDVFHKGHEHYLKEAKSLGDFLTVVVSRDVNFEKLKGKKPKNDEEKRLKIISENDYVDEAVLGYPDDLFEIIIDEEPNIVCLGYDQWVKEAELKKILEERGLFGVKIVRAKPYQPKKYKSSKL